MYLESAQRSGSCWGASSSSHSVYMGVDPKGLVMEIIIFFTIDAHERK